MGYPVHPPLDGTFARPALRPDPRLGGRPMGTAAAWAKTSAESWGLCRQMMVLWKYPLVNKHNYGKSQFSMGKWMLFFHSYVKLPKGNILNNGEIHLINWELYIYVYIIPSDHEPPNETMSTSVAPWNPNVWLWGWHFFGNWKLAECWFDLAPDVFFWRRLWGAGW